MIRTQIQLTEKQSRILRQIARERRVSMAAVIRDAVDTVVEEADYQAKRARALQAIGRHGGGGSDVAREHDRYLEEAYAD